MRIINITDKNQFNEFVIRAGGSFLQSYEWGEFQEKIGAQIWRLGVEEGGKLIAAATIIKKRLPFGKSYCYCPRGPIGNFQFSIFPASAGPRQGGGNFQLVFDFLFDEIEKIAESEKVIFLRFEPLFEILNSKFEIRNSFDVQPSKTLILDLNKSEEELLANMHQKTRYNIKLAEKKGVKIIEAGKEKFEDFWRLIDQTSGRDKFRPHGRDYYKAMLDIEGDFDNLPIPPYQGGGNPLVPPLEGGLEENALLVKGGVGGFEEGKKVNFIRLFFAEYEGKLITAGIFSFFGDTVTYLHGGSADEFRNVMAPYLLQWQVIKLAKSSGSRYYDFYGIDENKWPGVTRFKKGFGGAEVKYPGTFDLVFDRRWYSIYKMVRRIRRSV
jgi:lipid II:glycine glycyltransferase (peptidoglycan interpeptide bridge formation enzyme)